jgi:hypothetical protein
LADNCDEVRIAFEMEVGLWTEALNVMVRTFCGCDCAEMVQRQSRWKCEGKRKRTRAGEKEARFAEANRAFGGCDINCS